MFPISSCLLHRHWQDSILPPHPPSNSNSFHRYYKDSTAASTSAAWVSNCADRWFEETTTQQFHWMPSHLLHIFHVSLCLPSTCCWRILPLGSSHWRLLGIFLRGLEERPQGIVEPRWRSPWLICWAPSEQQWLFVVAERNIYKHQILVNFYLTKCIYIYVYGHIIYQNKCSPKEIWTPLHYL